MGVSNRTELGDFLRRRREELSPADAGLPRGTRRRTPGLRRDEVAALASMSPTYYERLEQGRGSQPSASMLRGLACVLRLSVDERDYLYRLAGQAAPVLPEAPGYVDPGLAAVMSSAARTAPAFITDDLNNCVAQNRLNLALFGRVAGLPGRDANLVWRWFTSPRWRAAIDPPDQQEGTSHSYVADLRATLGQRGSDPAAAALADDLRLVSAEFAEMWDQHHVSALACSAKVVRDRRVGRLDLECVIVTSPLSRQRLLLLQPAEGTDSAERLARLDQVIG